MVLSNDFFFIQRTISVAKIFLVVLNWVRLHVNFTNVVFFYCWQSYDNNLLKYQKLLKRYYPCGRISNPAAMPADVLYYWQGHSCQTGRRVEARLRLIWFFAPSYWGFSTGLLTLSRKKKFCYGNLEHSWVSIQKAGRGHTAVKVLCCRPVCKWAWWAVGMTGSDVFVDLKTQSFNAPYFKNENGKPPPSPHFIYFWQKLIFALLQGKF